MKYEKAELRSYSSPAAQGTTAPSAPGVPPSDPGMDEW